MTHDGGARPAAAPVFTITYWGTTGTMAAPLRPGQLTDRIVAALQYLHDAGQLATLATASDGREHCRRLVEQHLPFHLRSTFGGNTTCVEVQTPDSLILIDCGSGLRELGIDLNRRWNAPDYQRPRCAHVLVSHAHMDHTFGTPYMDPYYDERNDFTLYASTEVMNSLTAVLCADAPLSNTYFPPTFELLKALRHRHTIDGQTDFHIGSTRVTTLALNHPGGCLGFRLENAGKTFAFAFATDHEQPEMPDRRLAEFLRGADLAYLDGQYLQAEYLGRTGIMGETPMSRVGWGHSTVEACVATAVLAGVHELHVGHREPKRDDADLARVERLLQEEMRSTLRSGGRPVDQCRALIPFEGMTVYL